MFEIAKRIKDEIRSMSPNFGYNGFGEIVYYRTYSRIMDNGQQESWADTVLRVVQGTIDIRKMHMYQHNLPWDEEFYQYHARDMAKSLFRLQWSPPGRGLWAMGTKLIKERGSMPLFNCAFSQIGSDWIKDLCWMMDLLMNGVGVGFEAVRDHLELPPISGKFGHVYTVNDSREGWVNSVKYLLQCIADGDRLPRFDYSYIRIAGEPLRTFGGTASGPGPLIELHKKIVWATELYIEGAIDVVRYKTDLANLIGCCVVAGNIRRSAEIALGHFDDPTFLDLKNYKIHPDRADFGWMSNNSAIFKHTTDFDSLNEVAYRVVRGDDLGIMNKKNFKYARIGDKNYIKDVAIGLNPCVIGSSIVLTNKGTKRIDQVKVGDVVWTETGWTNVSAFFDQGLKSVYKYVTTAGEIVCTEDHKLVSDGFKIPASCVDSVDTLLGTASDDIGPTHPYYVMLGLVYGDGYNHHKQTLLCIGENDQDYFKSEISSYITKPYSNDYTYCVGIDVQLPTIKYLRTVPDYVLYAHQSVQCSFLRGLYSANGCVVNNTIRLKSISKELIIGVQSILSSLGIPSFYTTNKSKENVFYNGNYMLAESYDLTISVGRELFVKHIGFIQNYKNEKIDISTKGKCKTNYDIIAVEYCGEQQVYDITVDNHCHTFWCNGLNISNCAEIPLENKEVCNLAITCPTRCADVDEWIKACEYATFYCSTVTLLPTHSAETNAVVARNHRIGVDILDFIGWSDQIGTNQVIKALRRGYKHVKSVNRRMAREAGVAPSLRLTTIKPNGTVSKLMGRSPNYPNARYMLRRIRIQRGTQLDQILQEANIPFEKCVNQPDYTHVFEYPIYNGTLREVSEVSLWEQAMNVILLQREWADNAVSNTLYFSDKEKDDVEHVLSSIVPAVKSVSMAKQVPCLGGDDAPYAQMPEQRISSIEFKERLNSIERIDWTRFRGDGIDERYCDNDTCVVSESE